jgi:hypothetical protein
MKLVTICIDLPTMTPEYVPGRCNIGRRGRAIGLSTGGVLIALSVGSALTILLQANPLLRVALGILIYVGLLAGLEGSMSFCVLHAARGTYDLSEPHGFASTKSKTLERVGSDEWKRIDRRKALRMHAEAAVGAIVIAVLLTLA